MKTIFTVFLFSILLSPSLISAQYVENTLCNIALKNLNTNTSPYTSMAVAAKYCHVWDLQKSSDSIWKKYQNSHPAIASFFAEKSGKGRWFSEKLRKKTLSGKTFAVKVEIEQAPSLPSVSPVSLEKYFWKYHVRTLQHYGGRVLRNLHRNRFLYQVQVDLDRDLDLIDIHNPLEQSPCPITKIKVVVTDLRFTKEVSHWDFEGKFQSCKDYENLLPLLQKIHEYQ